MLLPSTLLSLPLIFLSTLITLSTNNWLMIWLSLEINMISMCPIISSPPHLSSTHSTMKYFLIQTVSSSLFLFTCIILNSFPSLLSPTVSLIMILKLGMLPFHHWLLPIINNSSWTTTSILLTWQKLAPMFIISLLPSTITLISTILSAVLAPTLALSTSSTRLLMVYSSISHMAWTTSTINLSSTMWITYLTIYSLNTLSCLSLMQKTNMHSLTHTLSTNPVSPLLFLLLLNLSGMPPLPGFLPKWMTLELTPTPLATVLITSSSISLLIYLNISFPSLTPFPLNKPQTPLTSTPSLSISLLLSFLPFLLLN